MKLKINIFLLISGILIFYGCARNGCPGGMCPPDHYYIHHRLTKKTMSFGRHYSHAPLISFRRVGTRWSRSNSQNKITRGRHNIESPQASLSYYSKHSSHANIENKTYDTRSLKNMQSRFLNKRKLSGGKRGHHEGLWSPQMQNWQAKTKPAKKIRQRQRVRTKKLH